MGFIIFVAEGIKADPNKVETIREWRVPRSTNGVQRFINFVDYYRDFIPDFGKIAEPLLNLTKKFVTVKWEKRHQVAFDKLKELLIKAPVLDLWNEKKRDSS